MENFSKKFNAFSAIFSNLKFNIKPSNLHKNEQTGFAVCSFFSTFIIKQPAFYRFLRFLRARLPVRAQAQGLARNK
jgi:hypothetical protein